MYVCSTEKKGGADCEKTKPTVSRLVYRQTFYDHNSIDSLFIHLQFYLWYFMN